MATAEVTFRRGILIKTRVYVKNSLTVAAVETQTVLNRRKLVNLGVNQKKNEGNIFDTI